MKSIVGFMVIGIALAGPAALPVRAEAWEGTVEDLSAPPEVAALLLEEGRFYVEEGGQDPTTVDLRIDLNGDGHPEYVKAFVGWPETRGRGTIVIVSGKAPHRVLMADHLTYQNGVTGDWRFELLEPGDDGYRDIQLEAYQYRWNGAEYEIYRPE